MSQIEKTAGSLLQGIECTVEDRYLLVRSRDSLEVLSSAVVGGGFQKTSTIFILNVPSDYNHPFPEEDLRLRANKLGVPKPFVGLMTAVPLRKTRIIREQEGSLKVVLIATVGLGCPIAAGITPPQLVRAGTINLIAIVDGRVPPSALVNLVATATEAKVLALKELGVRTPEGHPATGTATDAVVIGCTGRGPYYPYGGSATSLGWTLGRAVRKALLAKE